MKSRISASVVMLTLACVSLAGMQPKPNLNGLWKMNPQKSKFGPRGAPQSILIKFAQQDGAITETYTVAVGGQERTIELRYTTDGKESVNQIGDDLTKTTAKWEEKRLVIEWKREGGVVRRTFTLSSDGKVLTIAVFQGAAGEPVETLILEKQ
jgi:hypothetical protein